MIDKIALQAEILILFGQTGELINNEKQTKDYKTICELTRRICTLERLFSIYYESFPESVIDDLGLIYTAFDYSTKKIRQKWNRIIISN